MRPAVRWLGPHLAGRTAIVIAEKPPPPHPGAVPEGQREHLVIGDVRRVQAENSDEAWEREIDDEDDGEVRFVEALRSYSDGAWTVAASVMEFVREEPLEGELRRRITVALRSVEGVEMVDEMDTEAWLVTGTPAGPALIRAVAEVLDDLASQTLPYVQGLG